jgi:hypothetical protein
MTDGATSTTGRDPGPAQPSGQSSRSGLLGKRFWGAVWHSFLVGPANALVESAPTPGPSGQFPEDRKPWSAAPGSDRTRSLSMTHGATSTTGRDPGPAELSGRSRLSFAQGLWRHLTRPYLRTEPSQAGPLPGQPALRVRQSAATATRQRRRETIARVGSRER